MLRMAIFSTRSLRRRSLFPSQQRSFFNESVVLSLFLSHTSLSAHSPPKLTDFQIHQNYYFFPRFLNLCKLFISKTESAKFENMIKDREMKKSLGSYLLYMDLQVDRISSFPSHLALSIQHPLLLKYNFDRENFCIGAKDSFQNIYQIIQSKEFKDNLQE
jgi:hypothetical protein